jgi:hypothetical protein
MVPASEWRSNEDNGCRNKGDQRQQSLEQGKGRRVERRDAAHEVSIRHNPKRRED